MRIENDSLGTMAIEDNILYGIQTSRAIDNFPICNSILNQYPSLIQGLAYVKAACAQANNQLGIIESHKADAIYASCIDLIKGNHHCAFAISMIQGGAGTSTNMNANEVIANLALFKLGHRPGQYQYQVPINDVNLSQSTNDAYPTAIRLGLLIEQPKLLASLTKLVASFKEKAKEFSDIHKVARTQLQDAVPMTLGQEFGGYAAQVTKGIDRVRSASTELEELALGGTATGTGINTHPDFAKKVLLMRSPLNPLHQEE